eukprot:scaffold4198_cov123-Isochrysis_galbana.AAC.1
MSIRRHLAAVLSLALCPQTEDLSSAMLSGYPRRRRRNSAGSLSGPAALRLAMLRSARFGALLVLPCTPYVCERRCLRIGASQGSGSSMCPGRRTAATPSC